MADLCPHTHSLDTCYVEKHLHMQILYIETHKTWITQKHYLQLISPLPHPHLPLTLISYTCTHTMSFNPGAHFHQPGFIVIYSATPVNPWHKNGPAVLFAFTSLTYGLLIALSYQFMRAVPEQVISKPWPGSVHISCSAYAWRFLSCGVVETRQSTHTHLLICMHTTTKAHCWDIFVHTDVTQW